MQNAADTSGHGKTDIGVDVDLADSHAGSLAELALGDTDSVRELAADGVDLLDVLLRNRGSTVKNDREAGQAAANLFEDVEAERRRNQNALFVAGALLGGELICAVGGADGDGEGVNTGAGDEFLDLFGTGVGGILSADLDVVLDAGQTAELALDNCAALVCVLDDTTGQLDVVLEGMVRAVDHDGGEAAVDAGLADLEICAMVEVEGEVNASILDGSLSKCEQVCMLCILTCAGRDLKDNRGLLRGSSLGDGLNDLHVVDVERADGVAAGIGLFEHFLGGYKCHCCLHSFLDFAKIYT